MANSKITELPDAGPLEATDLLAIVQGTATKVTNKVRLDQLALSGFNGVEVIKTVTDEYEATITIVGCKLITEVKIHNLPDVNTTYDVTIVPAGKAKFFRFQSYVQSSDINTVGTGSNGTEFGPITVNFNKLIDENYSESFGMMGRLTTGLYAVSGAEEYPDAAGGGAVSPQYYPDRILPFVDTTSIIMTIDKSVSKEIEQQYSIVIEGLLIHG